MAQHGRGCSYSSTKNHPNTHHPSPITSPPPPWGWPRGFPGPKKPESRSGWPRGRRGHVGVLSPLDQVRGPHNARKTTTPPLRTGIMAWILPWGAPGWSGTCPRTASRGGGASLGQGAARRAGARSAWDGLNPPILIILPYSPSHHHIPIIPVEVFSTTTWERSSSDNE